MKFVTVLFALIAGFSTHANQEEIEALKKRIKTLEANKEVLVRDKDSSRANRKKLKYGFDIGTGAKFSEFGASINGNYIIDEKRVLTLSYFGSSDNDYTYYNGQEYIDETYALQIGAKLFTSNSFYIQPSVYYRKHKHSQSDLFDISDLTYDYYLVKIEDIGFSVSIGNQWQWSNFSLGVEWIGYARQLVALSSLNTDRDYFVFKEESVHLLHIYLGANF